MRRDGPNAVVFDVAGDLDLPAGGIVLDPSLPGRVTRLVVNGADVPVGGGELVVRTFPATVRVEWAAAAPAS